MTKRRHVEVAADGRRMRIQVDERDGPAWQIDDYRWFDFGQALGYALEAVWPPLKGDVWGMPIGVLAGAVEHCGLHTEVEAGLNDCEADEREATQAFIDAAARLCEVYRKPRPEV